MTSEGFCTYFLHLPNSISLMSLESFDAFEEFEVIAHWQTHQTGGNGAETVAGSRNRSIPIDGSRR